MLVDRTHRAWMAVTLMLFLASTAAYVAYVQASPDGPRGGSVAGLAFGIAGSLLMIFAGLLSGRKKLAGWPLGSAQAWLKGHIWLGLLSGPLILFHSGFRWGGLLEQIVLGLALLIIASGVFGLLLQQMLPRVMKGLVPGEAMFDQLPHVCAALCRAADEAVGDACGAAVLLDPTLAAGEPRGLLAEFYRETVRPFLQFASPRSSPLAEATAAEAALAQLRECSPLELRACLDRLDKLCEERRQLLLQARLHGWLHGWLLLHVPLSAALLVLGVVHAVMAVWY